MRYLALLLACLILPQDSPNLKPSEDVPERAVDLNKEGRKMLRC